MREVSAVVTGHHQQYNQHGGKNDADWQVQHHDVDAAQKKIASPYAFVFFGP